MPGTRCSRVAMGGLTATLLATTACIDHSLAAAGNLAPQPRQSVLLLEGSDLTPQAGTTVTIRGRLLRGAQVAPVGAFSVRLAYDTALLALAPTVNAGVDANGFGLRTAVASATVPAPVALMATADQAGTGTMARRPLTPSRKSFPARAAARLGHDTLALAVVRARAARQAALATAVTPAAATPAAATPAAATPAAASAGGTPEGVLVPEGLRAVHLVRAGEVRVASVVPDGLQGELLFEVPFVVKRPGALATLTLVLDDLVSVAFEDQRALTRVERVPVRRSTP
ncbi:hypothetical protein [Gemmatimonas sp.]|uniref:hypothetical protein n=1 Tax=Gemmatimonas sp. TaxID=1962908 RepID=UPI0025B8C6CA|nr:hypothetical protein [Gemmatimonas sp.]MCA2992977.1 hypothetical protein [Gemmatimonas sp.]